MNKLIIESLGNHIIPDIKYHSDLPFELQEWYAYIKDAGHCIACILKVHLDQIKIIDDYKDYLVPIPVKIVLKGYTMKDEFVVVDLPYDGEVYGVIYDDDFCEFQNSNEKEIFPKHILEVGKPYIEGKTWADGKVEYNYYKNGHELRFFFASPTNQEINAIRKGKVELGLFIQDSVIFLLYKFIDYKNFPPKEVIDGDAPYSIHLVPENMRQIPEITDNKDQRALLEIHLVDANTGILKVLRTVTFSTEFTYNLHTAIKEQLNTPFDNNKHNTIIQSVYSKYQTTDSMFNHAFAKCTGGD